MKTIFKNTLWLFLAAFVIPSCSQDKESEGETVGVCGYSITIEGETTHPNRYGQDQLIFASTLGPDGRGGITISVIQTKSDGEAHPAFQFNCDITELFSKHTSVGTTYEVNSFMAIELNLPDLGDYVYHMDYNRSPEEGVINVTVLENSEKQMRFEVSGTIMKKLGGVENWTNIELVPVEAEFTIGRDSYIEMSSNGVNGASANCDCR